MVERWKERKSQMDAGLRLSDADRPSRRHNVRVFVALSPALSSSTLISPPCTPPVTTASAPQNHQKQNGMVSTRICAPSARVGMRSTQCLRTRGGLMQRSSSGKLWAALYRNTAALHRTKSALDGYTGGASLDDACPDAAGSVVSAVRLWPRSWSQRGVPRSWRSHNTVQP